MVRFERVHCIINHSFYKLKTNHDSDTVAGTGMFCSLGRAFTSGFTSASPLTVGCAGVGAGTCEASPIPGSEGIVPGMLSWGRGAGALKLAGGRDPGVDIGGRDPGVDSGGIPGIDGNAGAANTHLSFNE